MISSQKNYKFKSKYIQANNKKLFQQKWKLFSLIINFQLVCWYIKIRKHEKRTYIWWYKAHIFFAFSFTNKLVAAHLTKGITLYRNILQIHSISKFYIYIFLLFGYFSVHTKTTMNMLWKQGLLELEWFKPATYKLM